MSEKASILPLDVSSSKSIEAAAGRFEEIADRLDVLINNAGIYPDEGRPSCPLVAAGQLIRETGVYSAPGGTVAHVLKPRFSAFLVQVHLTFLDW
ncbi:SDR family NAD(P)-dependent oxidoreductase [Gimesia sp.]|uniref:SDR family NAD(P)-dependent oxidoreductase n=1 Tax=Gimesia sp. TaxID=2024833 RepID=UPI003A934241